MNLLTRKFLLNWVNIIIVLVVSVILSSAHFMVSGIEENISIYSPFKGYIPGGLMIGQWAVFVMTNLFIVYIIGIFCDNINNKGNTAFIIRYVKKVNWIKEIEFITIIGTLIFSAIYIGVSFVVGVFLIENIFYDMKSFLFFALFWALEMITISELFIALYLSSKNTLVSFTLILIGYMMVCLPTPISLYIPFGISSAQKMSFYNLHNRFEICISFLILILTFLVSRVILYKLGKKKTFES